jgi:hypothetical protein
MSWVFGSAAASRPPTVRKADRTIASRGSQKNLLKVIRMDLHKSGFRDSILKGIESSGI